MLSSSSSSSFCHSPVAPLKFMIKLPPQCNIGINNQVLSSSLRSHRPNLLGLRVPKFRADLDRDWSFIGGSRVTITRPQLAEADLCPKGLRVSASWLAGLQLANSAFALGTVAVLPFYTLMVVAPKAELTKRSIQSGTPFVVLGLLYAYLLYLSWTSDTVHYIFASKYLLPELTGIAKMFSNEMTLASAWIHLLAVDLFAARQVYYDGLENEIETRHSVSLCLFFCPIGIVAHVITKALTQIPGNSTEKRGM